MAEFTILAFLTEACPMNILAWEIFQVMREVTLRASMTIICQEKLADFILEIRCLNYFRRRALETFTLLSGIELILLRIEARFLLLSKAELTLLLEISNSLLEGWLLLLIRL